MRMQMNTKNHIQLLEDVNEAAVEAVANKLGLRRVGWIFTDLVADSSTGNVKHFRGNIVSPLLAATIVCYWLDIFCTKKSEQVYVCCTLWMWL